MKRMRKVYASNNVTTNWSQLSDDELLDIMVHYFDSVDGEYGSTQGFLEYAASLGIDVSDMSSSEVNELWDLASESFSESNDITIDGQTICTKSDAYTWLQSKIEEYGNTYHFPEKDKISLDRLIDKFGNTYFWRDR